MKVLFFLFCFYIELEIWTHKGWLIKEREKEGKKGRREKRRKEIKEKERIGKEETCESFINFSINFNSTDFHFLFLLIYLLLSY